jgi:GDSL-like Lipase/Acylhydrolase family
MASRLRSVLSTLAIAAASLLAAEIALRLADFRILRQDASERSLAYDYDGELGWAPVPNSVSTVTTARTIHATHNSLGFRDIEYRPDGRPLILFLGDSFVWGVDAEAGERFTDLLREKIPRYSILNAGVSGYGTDQEFIWLKRIWSTLHPAIVVLFFCTDNDRLDNTTNVRYAGYRKPYFEASIDGTLTAKGQPVPRSLKLLIRDSWWLRHSWLARVAGLAYVEMSSPQLSVPDPTEKLIGGIHDFVADHNAKLLVALQRPDDQLASFLRSRQIPFLALDGIPAFSAKYGAHFTPEGNEMASRQLLPFLTEQTD